MITWWGPLAWNAVELSRSLEASLWFTTYSSRTSHVQSIVQTEGVLKMHGTRVQVVGSLQAQRRCSCSAIKLGTGGQIPAPKCARLGSMFWETNPKCRCSYLIFQKYTERASLNTASKLMPFSLIFVVTILSLLIQLPLPRKIIYKPTQLEPDMGIILSLSLINGVWAKWYSKNTL